MSDTPHNSTFTQPSAGKAFTKTTYLLTALLTVATFAILSPSLSCGFVEWDDPYYMLQNEHLKPFATTWDWGAIQKMFSSDINGNYNPLPIFTFAIEKYFFSPNPEAAPFIYHLDNLLLHIACTILVFIIFIRLGIGQMGAFIGAMLFGIHPMRIESVAWVTERKDVLYGLFYFAAISCYLSYVNATSKKTKWFLLTIFLALLSSFSKIQAVSLPLSLVAIDYITGKNWKNIKTLFIEKLPFWSIALAFGIINLSFIYKGGYLDATSPIAAYNLIGKFAIGAYSYAIYIAKWVFPYTTTHYYAAPSHVPMVAYAMLLLVPAAIVSLFIWSRRKDHSHIIFGIAFFTANIIFLLQILPVGNAYLADRFTYVAYMGLFFIVGKTYDTVTTKYPTKLITAGIILYCTALSFMAYNQTKVWTDTLTLCEHNIKCFPHSYYGHNQAGIYYMKLSAPDGDNSVKNPRILLQAQRSFIEANKLDSINGRPSPVVSSDIMQNLAVTHGLLGDNDIAIHYFSKAIALTPTDVEAYKNRAYQYFVSKQFDLAVADYTYILNTDPKNSNIYYLRANCHFSKQDLVNARSDLDKAINLDHTDPNYFIARSVINRAENKITEARSDAQIAQKLGADVPALYLQ